MSNAIDILGTNKNKRANLEFHKARLVKAVNGGTLKIEFMYSVVANARFTVTTTALAGFETTVPTKTIRTTRIDLPFVNGDAIEIDGELWTLGDIEPITSNQSAQVLGDGVVAFNLYLSGGKGNGRARTV